MTRGDGENRETAEEFESKELQGGLYIKGTFIAEAGTILRLIGQTTSGCPNSGRNTGF
jgi:hypothetical protein